MTTATDVQSLYIAYFNRPADPLGLAYWTDQIDNHGQSLVSVANNFALQPEYTANYAGMSTAQIVNQIYTNLFGHGADLPGLQYWVAQLSSGAVTTGKLALSVLSGATGADATAVTAKGTAAAAFTASVDTTPEVLAYNGAGANAIAKTWLSTVVDTTTATAAIATKDVAISNIVNTTVSNGTTFTLTTGIDTGSAFTGGSANDTFNATSTTTNALSAILGSLDTIDGAGGVNTLNIADSGVLAAGDLLLPTSFTAKNIQIENVATNGAVGNSTTAWDVSGQAGLTNLNVAAAGAGTTGGSFVKAASTTAVSLTTGGAATASIAGGSIDTVTAGTGTVSVVGSGLTNVTVNGGGVATIDNTASSVSGAGTTLTSVTLNGIGGATAAVKGKGLTTLNLTNQKSALAVTVTDTATSHALNVTTSAVGFDSTGAAVVVSVADSVATSAALTATGATNIVLNAAAATSLTIGGAGAVTLGAASTFGTLTKIDASANTGGVTATIGAAAATAAVTGGAGNDVITLGTAYSGTLTLGAGNNTLLAGTGSLSTTAVVNGGTGGVNTISAALVNAGSAGHISNFQILDLSGFGSGANNGALDTALVATPVSGLSITAAATNGTATILNLAASATLTNTFNGVAGDVVLTHAAGTATNSLAINFANTSTSSALTETINSVTSKGDTTVTIASGGKSTNAAFGNALTALNETDNTLTTVTITGAKAFTLGGVHTATGAALTTSTASTLKTIDGSAATGALNITAGATDTVNAQSLTYTGLTIKGGIGGDTIINNAKAGLIIEGATASTLINTLTINGSGSTINDSASAGADIIAVNGKGGTVLLGSGASTATFNAVVTTGNVGNVTFGSGAATVVDKITYQVAASGTSASTAGNYLQLNGTLSHETLSFNAAVANTGTLGAASTAVSAAQTFDQAVFLAENALVSATVASTANTVVWFTYAGNTYIENIGATTAAAGAVSTTDNTIVKISGIVDLSHATISAGSIVFA